MNASVRELVDGVYPLSAKKTLQTVFIQKCLEWPEMKECEEKKYFVK